MDRWWRAILGGVAVLALVAAVAGCGGSSGTTTSASTTEEVAPEESSTEEKGAMEEEESTTEPTAEIDPFATPTANWSVDGGNYQHEFHSALDEVDTSNVSQLKGDFMLKLESGTAAKYSHEENVLAIDGMLYIPTGEDDVIAVDPSTGEEVWRHEGELDPAISSVCCGWESRGLAWDGKETLYNARIDGKVVALNMKTGEVEWETEVFNWKTDNATSISAPLYYKGLLYIGNSGSEFLARGRVTALDATNGKVKWKFWTTGDGHDPVADPTWEGDSAKIGGSGLWHAPAIDKKTNELIFGTSTVGPDVNGSQRGGDNLYSNSIVAIDATTGEYKWHWQVVHHDVWDDTVNSPVVLFTAHIDGKSIPAAAITPKSPWVYAVNRETGKPIWPGKEMPVPQAPENKTSKTQWIPSYKPLVPMVITDQEYKEVVKQVRASEAIPNAKTIKIQRPPNNDPAKDVYTPSGTKVGASIDIGAPVGGTGWAPMSYSPENELLYACGQKGIGFSAQSPEDGKFTPGEVSLGGLLGAISFNQAGYLEAVDQNTGEPVWTYHTKNADGKPESCYAGSVTTAGNLVFVGKNDGEFVALNAKTGEELWHFQTGAGANAPATVFESEGEEKIAIVAGGNALAGSTHGANLWVFSLNGEMESLPGLEKAGEAITHAGEEEEKEPTEEEAGSEGEEAAAGGPDAEAGKEVFAENCSTCHGADGLGGNGGPDLTTMPLAKTQSGAEKQVTNGGGGMPAFGGSLSEEEIQNVAAYVVEDIVGGK
jgi:glucose dehydrogenase/mono/diheme cytochrome c family protein